MTDRTSRRQRARRSASRAPHVLIIVQNLPVPLDRRVWLECLALVRNGYAVSVICPKGPGDPAREVLDGVSIYKYKPAPEAGGLLGFAVEFSYSWVRTALLSLVVWRALRVDVIQACNPPDTYWLLAMLWRIRGVRFVYDQHDLNPELFLSRFGAPTSPLARAELGALTWLERRTYRAADHVISTNESYRSVALRRGGRTAADTTVVRSGPDTTRMRPVYPDPAIRDGVDHLLVYLGIMGPQDNVDQLLLVMEELVHRRGRTRIRLALLGFGDCLEDLRAEANRRGLAGHTEFTGRVGPAEIAQYLSAADVGLGPDLKTPLNDVSTMNKTMEYMAYCLPSVSFDLVEARRSAGDTGTFVPSGDIGAFADAVEQLLDDPSLRSKLGLAARERVRRDLDWAAQAEAYVSVYQRVVGTASAVPAADVGGMTQAPLGRPVDLTDPDEAERFVQERSEPRPAGHRGATP